MKRIIAAILFSAFSQAGQVINAIPGKSLGEVVIGASSAELRRLGFTLDQSRNAKDTLLTYFVKGDFLVRLKKDKVLQVWLGYSSISNLRINGKKLPSILSADSVKKAFKKCEEHQGSGGKIVYCEGSGVEFVFSFDNSPPGFSVILPSEVDIILGR